MIESHQVNDQTLSTYSVKKPGDEIIVAEFVFLHTAYGRVIAENFSITDTMLIMQDLDRVLSETSKLTDAIVFMKESFRQTLDVLSVTDGFQKSITRGLATVNEKVQVEDFVVTDSKIVTVSGIQVRQLTDTISINEAVKLASTKLRGESLSIVDSSDLIRIVNRTLNVLSDDEDPEADPTLVINYINVNDDRIVTRSVLISTKIVLDSLSVNDFLSATFVGTVAVEIIHGIEVS